MAIEFGNISMAGSPSLGRRAIRSVEFGDMLVWSASSVAILSASTHSMASGNTSLNISGGTAPFSCATEVEYVYPSTGSWITVGSRIPIVEVPQAHVFIQPITASTNNSEDPRTAMINLVHDGLVYESWQVTQEGKPHVVYYITLSQDFLSCDWEGNGDGKVINLTTNIPGYGDDIIVETDEPVWIVVSTPAYFQKTTIYILTNYGRETRNGHVYFKYNGETLATLLIHQDEGYYPTFYLMSQNPMSIDYGQRTFGVSLISRRGQTPVSATVGTISGDMSIENTGVNYGGSTGQWNFMFSCSANTGSSPRSGSIVFNQSGTSESITLTLNQGVMPRPISGVTTKAAYGQWVLGTFTAGTASLPIGEYPTVGIAVARPQYIDKDYIAVISMNYQNGPMTSGTSPTSYTVEDEVYNIKSGSTFDVPSAGTNYGSVIISPVPRQQINQVTAFTVKDKPYVKFVDSSILRCTYSAQTIDVAISANTSWSASTQRTWVSADKVNNSTLRLTLQENTGGDRISYVYLNGEYGSSARTSVLQSRLIT